MQTWFDKMKEYLKMDEEIPMQEFSEYLQGFYAYLGPVLDTLSKDDLVKARFMSSILQGNASDRASRKGPDMKKYKKMAEKSALWVDAITYRLVKAGMAPADIEKATQEVSDSID